MQTNSSILRLGTALWGFRKMTLKEIICACPKMEIKRLEGHIHPDVPLHFRMDMTDSELKEITQFAGDLDITFATLATANSFTAPAAQNHENLEWIKGTIRFANKINVQIIRIFAGWVPKDQFTNEIWDGMIKSFSDAAEYASSHGIILALENHGGITTTAEDMLRIIDAVNSPSLKLNFDPANFRHAGVNCLEAYEKIKKHVVYMHLKDVKIKTDGKMDYCAAGEGDIPWKKLIPIILNNYQGVCSIEYEDAQDPIEGTFRSVNFLKTLSTLG